MKTIFLQTYHSPCGEILLGSCDGRLCLCDWMTDAGRREAVDKRLHHLLDAAFEPGSSDVTRQASEELDAYFAHRQTAFSVPLLFAGTDFQKRVWSELLTIPYGKTVSYAELAQRVGNPKAVRAVASANRMNALSIFVPCHRVIGSNRQLTGYAGGLQAKAYLLNLEQENMNLFNPYKV